MPRTAATKGPAPEKEVTGTANYSRVEHLVYTVTAEPNVAGGISASDADARLSARLAAGQTILHISSSPYIDTNTREELGTRVFAIIAS